MSTFEEKKRAAYGASAVIVTSFDKRGRKRTKTVEVGTAGHKPHRYGRGNINNKFFKEKPK